MLYIILIHVHTQMNSDMIAKAVLIAEDPTTMETLPFISRSFRAQSTGA